MMRYNGASGSLRSAQMAVAHRPEKTVRSIEMMSQGTVGISNTISRRTDGFTAWTVAPPFIRASCTSFMRTSLGEIGDWPGG